MSLSLKPKHLSRYKDIAWLFYKYGRSDWAKAAGVAGMLEPEDRPKAEEQAPQADKLADDLEKMGPTFIKLGQLLSTRPDIMPPAYLQALTRLQDKVQPFAFEEAKAILAEEIGVRLTSVFLEIDPHPLAAASLGQVHRATLRDGRAVVVKVQRPGIRQQVTDDLASLHEVANFLDGHTELGKRYEIGPIVQEFERTILCELDYRQEARNLVTLGRNLKEFKHLRVPGPIEDLSTSRVLTMQYIAGQKITTLSPVVRLELDGAMLAEELFQAYLQQILVDGFYHADPHPGNVLLTNDSCIALLDLGMVARISPHFQDKLLELLLALSESRTDAAVNRLIDVGEKKEDFNETKLNRAVNELVAQNKDNNLKHIDMGRVVLELGSIAADCGIRMPTEFTMLGKTLLNLDRLGATLDPEFNPNESLRRNATKILQQRLTQSATFGNVYSTIMEAKEFAEKLPTRVNRILDAIGNNDLEFKVQAIDEDKLMSGFQKVANRISQGLILAALIIGAALMMRIKTEFQLFGYPGLAIILFLLAAAGGISMIVQILIVDSSTKKKR